MAEITEIICNTSVLQYLHQLRQLPLLPVLVGTVIVPPAVITELEAGRMLGVDVPQPQDLDWITLRRPSSAIALPLVTDLGAGEREVLALALELPDSIAILDDGLARRVAQSLGIRIKGTLGILLDAKRSELIAAVAPLLDQLDVLGFRLSDAMRTVVLKLAQELEEELEEESEE